MLRRGTEMTKIKGVYVRRVTSRDIPPILVRAAAAELLGSCPSVKDLTFQTLFPDTKLICSYKVEKKKSVHDFPGCPTRGQKSLTGRKGRVRAV